MSSTASGDDASVRGNNTASLPQLLELLQELDALKQVERRTYVNGGARRENAAEHSWHVALAAWALAGFLGWEVSVGRLLQLALVHDLGELDAGDTFLYAEDRDRVAAAERAGVVRQARLWHEVATPRPTRASGCAQTTRPSGRQWASGERCEPVNAPRRAGPGDLETALAIVDRARQALLAAGIAQWDALYPTRATLGAAIQAGSLFVHSAGADIVGLIGLDHDQPAQYERLPWTTGLPALVVHHLCVDPDHQRRGHATTLMGFAEGLARQAGCAGIRPDAYSGNPAAVALYTRRGYVRVGATYFPRRSLPFVCFERAVELGRVSCEPAR